MIEDWAKRVAVPLPQTPGGVPALARALDGQDLIFLGELNHFVHEKGDFRLAFVPTLLAAGWRAFAEELGWSDGWRVQAYLDGGDPADLERLSVFGHEAHRRADRPDRMGGVLASSAQSYPTRAFKAEQSRFYAALRRAARKLGRSIAYRGMDIDGLPGGAYEDLAAWLAPDEQAALARVPGESAEAEAGRLRAFAPRLVGRPEAAAALAALADSLDYVARTYHAADYEALRPGMAFREDCMKRRVAAALALRPPGVSGLVLMAHAFHLAKDDRLFPQGVGGVGPGGGLTASLGHHLVQALGLKAYSIWMIYGQGEDSQPFADLPRTARYPPDSLNRRVALFDRPVFLPLDEAPDELLHRPIGVGHMYNAVTPTCLADQVDALYVLPRATPLRADA